MSCTLLRILIDDVFLESSRCNKYKSDMSNKRMKGPSRLLSKQKKRDHYRAVTKEGRTESVFCKKQKAMVAHLLEQVSKIL
jgi:hypothetical protein